MSSGWDRSITCSLVTAFVAIGALSVPKKAHADCNRTVVGRHTFYNNSFYDKAGTPCNNTFNGGQPCNDNSAIAPNVIALLPGQAPVLPAGGGQGVLSNYSSYSRGINGIMIDVQYGAGCSALTAGALTAPQIAATLEFVETVAGNSGRAVTSAYTGATRVPTSVTVAPHPTLASTDRITIIFADDTSANSHWLRTRLLPGGVVDNLGGEDRFYLGWAKAEGMSVCGINAVVGCPDQEGPTPPNHHTELNRAPIDDSYDYNRDSLVDNVDVKLAKQNATTPSASLCLSGQAEGTAGTCAGPEDDITITDITSTLVPLPPDNQTRATLTLVTDPPEADPEVDWEIKGDDYGCTLTHSGTKTATVGDCERIPPDGKKLEIRIETQDWTQDCVDCRKLFLEISCGGATCSGNCSVGEGSVSNGSVSFSVSLGTAAEGNSAGRLFIEASEPDWELYTPGALQRTTGPASVEAIEEAGVLRQVKSPQGVVDIIPHASGYKYTIAVYLASQASGPTGGLYTFAGDPIVQWLIGHPDVIANDQATPADETELSVLKLSGTGVTQERYDYVYTSGSPSGWSLATRDPTQQGEPVVRLETKTSTISGSDRTETHTIRQDANSPIEQEITRVHHMYSWGEELVQERIDPSGADLTTDWTYLAQGRMETVRNDDGSWVNYTYDQYGRLTKELRPWLDSAPTTTDNQARAIVYDYTSQVFGDTVTTSDSRPRKITESILGTPVARTYHAYLVIVDQQVQKLREIEKRCLDPDDGYTATTNLTTTTTYTDTTGTRVETIDNPDGTRESYEYENGSYNPSTFTFTPGSGDDLRTTVKHVTTASPGGTAFKSTADATVTDEAGLQRLQQKLVRDDQAWQVIETTKYEYNERGQLERVTHPNGTATESFWGCCHKDAEVDESGIGTTYDLYDMMGNLLQMTRLELPAVQVSEFETYPVQPGLSTIYTYDAVGRQLSTTMTDGTLTQTTSQTYDTAGRVLTSTGADELVTQFAYDTASGGGRKVTRTLPGGAAEVTEYFRDGKIKSVTGTAVVNSFYSYGVNTNDQTQWTSVSRGDSGSPEWVEKTTNDPLGRVVKVEKPGYNGAVLTTTHSYNALGQLVKTTPPGQRPTLYQYDAQGELEITALDVDGSNTIGLASTDRVTQSVSQYEYDAGTSSWYRTSSTIVYTAVGGDGNPITPSTVKQRLTGLAAGTIEEAYSYDALDNVTHAWTTLDDTTHLVRRFTDVPDSTNDVLEITRGGLLLASRSKTFVRTSFGYDGLTRRTTVTDSRGNTTTTAYNSLGQVESLEDADENVTSYAYYDDESTMAGRLKSQTDALTQKQYFEYSPRGELLRTWGDTTYPVEHVYDALGRRTELHTFRTGGSWSSDSWATAVSGNTPDVTYWVYDPGSGLLLAKVYEDDTGVAYDYTSEGRLLYRYWMRGFDVSEPVWAHYEYDAYTGELTDIHYFKGSQSDPDTPDVAFTYDRLGRQDTVTDAVGTRTFAYRDNVSTDGDLQLKTEDIVAGGGGLYSKLITRKYQTAGTNQLPGRSSGFLIGHSGDPDADYEASYAYSSNSRMVGVVKGPGLNVGGATYTFGNGDLVTKTSFKDIITTKASATFTYEPYRDLLASVENKRDASPAGTISKYAYVNDDLGRRTSVANTGTAFSEDAFNLWAYNDRSELTSSERWLGAFTPTPVEDQREMVTDQYRSYDYDSIGNRSYDQAGVDPNGRQNYVTNSLNQYEQTCGPDCEFMPGLSFEYDADGNLIDDDTYAYAWDGENRLIAVEPIAPWEGSKKVEFAYDYMSRRVHKRVWVYETGNWTLETDLRFVYDGWNVVLVLDATDEEDVVVRTKYTWGLDLSGQRGNGVAPGVSPVVPGIHGAGGIGGLLAAEETATEGSPKYWFLHDANGNVSQIVENTTNYPVVAHYEYDAYGNTVTATGSYAAANPFRFSTKWRDAETGMYYYGRRYYDPRLGRWMNRDPIGENGGYNLYAHTRNGLPNAIDPFGLWTIRGVTALLHEDELAWQWWKQFVSEGGWLDVDPHSLGGGRSWSHTHRKNVITLDCTLAKASDRLAAEHVKEALRHWAWYAPLDKTGTRLRQILFRIRPKYSAAMEMAVLVDAAHWASHTEAAKSVAYSKGDDDRNGRGYGGASKVANALSYAYLGTISPSYNKYSITYVGNRAPGASAVSGYHPIYWDSNNPTGDQGHHFVFYFYLGVDYPSILDIALDATGDFPPELNPGDYHLGVLAHRLGKEYAASPQFMKHRIRDALGAQLLP